MTKWWRARIRIRLIDDWRGFWKLHSVNANWLTAGLVYLWSHHTEFETMAVFNFLWHWPLYLAFVSSLPGLIQVSPLLANVLRVIKQPVKEKLPPEPENTDVV